eukprot:jgi/Tetstr1/434544/TSEL_023635.t1
MCAISLGKEDEEFADTLRLAMALTSSVALLRAIRLRTIVIYLIASEFDPSELLIHPFRRSGTRENWEATRADDEEDLELNYEENDSAMEADTTQGEATETPYGLPVVGEEALVSAVTEAMYDRMNGHGHHMQGGLKPAMATFRGLSADLLVSFFEARTGHVARKVPRHSPGGRKKARYMATCHEGVESVAV